MVTIKSGRMAPLSAPIEVQLQPTNRCNANCLFCWLHDNKQDSDELPDERWLELADEICALDVPEVLICGGGEPLLRTKLVLQMMEKVSQAGIDGALITNGMLITEQFAKKMVELQWNTVIVSIHGPTAELNDFLMDKEGAFDLALRGIENMNRYKTLLKSALPELIMRIVLTPANISSLPEFIRLAHSRGMSEVFIRMDNQAETTRQRLPSGSEMSRPALKKALERASKVAEELKLRLRVEFDAQQLFPQDEPLEHNTESADIGGAGLPCPVPFSELVLFANGTASPCCDFVKWQFKSPEEREGIIEEMGNRSLNQVWHDGFPRLRSSMFVEHRLCSTCEVCPVDLQHRKSKWPESFFHIKFGHLRKHEKYEEGIRFGLEHLKQYPDNQTLTRYIEEFRKKLENKERESAEQLAQLFHDKFNNLRKQGKYEEGIQFGLKQLKEHRDSAVLHHHVGEFHMELKQYKKAIEHLSRAVQLDPKMEWTRFSLGKCFYLTGRYKEAEKAFKANLKVTSNRLSHFHSIVFRAMAANARGAQEECSNALARLEHYKELIDQQIPLEREFFNQLKAEKLLPKWITETLDG